MKRPEPAFESVQRPRARCLSRAAAVARVAAVAGALLLAGCSQVFPVRPLSADDQRYEQMLRTAGDSDAKVALGQLYFMHNEIDRAHAVLAPLVAAEPRNAQALAWFGANNCKRAGRRGPWLMGIDKMILVRECLEQIEQARRLAPEDFTVRMVQMETGHEVAMFGSLERAATTQQEVEKLLAARPQALPPEARAQFWLTAARIERKRGNAARAAQLLERGAADAQAPGTREEIANERRLLARG